MTPDGEQQPATDFATWRLRFSRVLDTDSLVYGQSVRLTRGGELVPAVMLAQDDAVSLDPRQDLRPGERYTLTLDTSVRAFDGTTLAEPVERSWVARDTRPRSVMVQNTPPASERADPCHAGTPPCPDCPARRSTACPSTRCCSATATPPSKAAMSSPSWPTSPISPGVAAAHSAWQPA
ncbi:hypothetical protein HML84_13705 [Alcanivorax sp. IO_7]|nr:hypothetical protein HML84_13705 [Alcanivorax sp. IO_7]